MDEFKISNALMEVSALVARTNKLIDDTSPWDLAKDENQAPVLESVMYHLLESIRIITVMYVPFLVTIHNDVFEFLGVEEEFQTFASCEFGIKKSYTVVKKPRHLFPRLDAEKEVEKIRSMMQTDTDTEHEEKEETPEVTIDDFAKLDIRVGKILEAKNHKDADKLLVFKIDTGDKVRNIVSGIAKFYKPEELLGKKVQVVANLKPVKLRGELSEGMILCGENAANEVFVIFASDKLEPGDKIS
jgi:methionyl-tRNA synthetase